MIVIFDRDVRPVPRQGNTAGTDARKSAILVVRAVCILMLLLCFGRHAEAAGAGLRGSVNNRAPGYLGISFRELTEDQVSTLRMGTGRAVEVLRVDHDGPAWQAGLHPQDVIIALNGQAIAGAEALRRLIHDAGAGVQIALGVLRGGKQLTVTAQLADRDQVERAAWAKIENGDPSSRPPAPHAPDVVGFVDEAAASAGSPDEPPVSSNVGPTHGQSFFGHLHAGPVTGAVLDPMEPQLASFFGAPQGTGLLVHSVLPGSAAADSGLRAGDVVVRADLYALRTVADWTKRLHAAKGHPLILNVIRDRREFTLTLMPDVKHHSMVEWPLAFR